MVVQPATPPRPPFMQVIKIKESKIGKIFQVIIFFIATFLLIVVAYFLANSFSKPVHAPILKPFAHSLERPTIAPAKTLQQILEESCQNIATDSAILTNISSLPITIDQSIMPISATGSANSPTCSGEDGKKFAMVYSANGNPPLIIYDSHSQQTTVSAYPIFGAIGKSFSQTDNIVYYYYLRITPDSSIGTEPVFIRAIKNISTDSKETILVSLEMQAIAQNDERLLTILNKYAIQKGNSAFKDIDGSKLRQVNIEIMNTFFSNPKNLQNSEGVALKKLQTLLSAVSSK